MNIILEYVKKGREKDPANPKMHDQLHKVHKVIVCIKNMLML